MTRSLLRPPGFDDLGVRRALSDRLLPCLVAAMTFLAALALAGAVGATALSQHWQSGAGGMITVQVPQPGDAVANTRGEPIGSTTRLDRVRAALSATAGIASTHTLSDDQLRVLLRPWLGTTTGDISIPLPAVIDVQVAGTGPDRATLVAALETAAPGTLVEEHDRWVKRLATLARSLQACAALAFAVVAFVAVAVIAVATRAGLASRRDAIEIVHGLGATDQFIARSFAQRATVLAGIGAGIGAVAALPVLASLAGLAAPFGNAAAPDGIAGAVGSIPLTLWLSVLCLPPLAAAIGWLTAHRTVRRWLRRLP